MALGRPSFIDGANTTTAMLSPSDFEDTNDASNEQVTKRPELTTGIHCFVAFAELTVILNEILSIFFTIKSVVDLREVSAEYITNIHDRIEQQLEMWRATYLDQILTQRFFPDVTGAILIHFSLTMSS